MMLDVFGLWLVGCLALQLAVHLITPAARRSGLAAALALGMQHAAVAAQAAGVATLITWWVPRPWASGLLGALWAAAMALLVVDGWLQTHFGLRLERGYVHFLSELRLFDTRWVAHSIACLAVTVTGAVVAGFWLLLGAGDAPPLQVGVAWWAVSVVGFAIAWVLWRRLPTTVTYGWNNRLFAAQMAGLLQQLRRRRQAAAPVVGVPDLLVSRNEEADLVDPRFPLLRKTQRFVGPTHFDVRLDPGERPHVVMLFIESFGARDIGILGGTHGVTPHFDAWSKRGILWRNFYANGTSTSRGALAGLYGLPPRFTEMSAQSHNPPHCIGLPDLFNKRGYRSSYFHNGPSRFEAKNPFFFDHGFASLHDRIALGKVYPGAEFGEWGLHDEYLMRFHLDWLQERDAAALPTFSTLFTVTNHYPFDVPRGAPEVPVDLHPNKVYRGYLRAMRYSDACLGEYLEGLQQRGLAEKTIVLVLADTGQEYQDDGGQGLTYSGRLTAAASRIPLLLLAPGRLKQSMVIDELASQVDLMPTLMDIFGMHDVHHGVGSSLRRQCSTRRPYLVHGHAPQFMALQDRPWNYTYSFDSNLQALHNIELDPREQQDVAAHHQARVATLQRDSLAMRAFCDNLYDTNAFAPAGSSTAFPMPRVPVDAAGNPPPGYPFSLEDMAARRAELVKIETPNIEAVRERRFLQMYLTSKLSDADKILAAQLQYKQTYQEEFGILTVAETDERNRLQELIDKAIWGDKGPAYRPKVRD